MISAVYENLLRLADDPSDAAAAAAIGEQIEDSSPECCYLTIKNYSEARGLSHFIHQDSESHS